MQRQSDNINFFKELMCKIKRSDEAAFTILYNRLWERMYALAFSLLKPLSLSGGGDFSQFCFGTGRNSSCTTAQDTARH